MNNSFAFINTGGEPVEVTYVFIDPDKGEKVEKVETLESKQTASSQGAQERFGLKKKMRLVDAKIKRRSGAEFSVMARSDAFGNAKDILKNSLIVDIETLGKDSGSVITQMGAYDVGTGEGKMYVFQPSVLSQKETKGDRGFKIKSTERVKVAPGTTFKELKYADYFAREHLGGVDQIEIALKAIKAGGPTWEDDIEKMILKNDFFQGRYFASEENLRQELFRRRGIESIDPQVEPGKYARKVALVEKEIEELRPIRTFMAALGDSMSESDIDLLFKQTRGDELKISELFTKFELKTGVSMKDFLTKDMPELLRGKVTWIANAAFESTQFGAQIDADANESLNALNERRISRGEKALGYDDFYRKFAYGGFEEELDAINATRGPDDQLITKNPMYGITEGVSTYDSKPFHVTGAEYSRARMNAFKKGDFSDLYKVFLKTTKAGDVRDIIDLVRMQQSTLIKGGYMTSTTGPASLSMEVQARVYGVTRALRAGKSMEEAYSELFSKELHIGIADVKLSESPVLEEALDQLEALRLVQEGGEEGRKLEALARKGEGAYFRAQVYGEIMDRLNTSASDKSGKTIDSLQDVLFRKRVGDALYDLSVEGTYTLREFSNGSRSITQLKDVGGIPTEVKVPIGMSKRVRHFDINLLFEESLKSEDYPSADKPRIIKELKDRFGHMIDEKGLVIPSLEEDFKKEAKALTESFGEQIQAIERRFPENAPQILESVREKVRSENLLSSTARRARGFVKNQGRRILNAAAGSGIENTPTRSFLAKKMSKYSSGISSFKKGYLGLAGVMFGASLIPKEEKRNLLIGSKEEFVKSRAKSSGMNEEDYINALKTRYNGIEGLPEKGLAALLRKRFTDFGSPYQSPRYSMSVLEDHNMRRERERYMSAQFGARHFSPQGDIGFFLKKFVDSAFRKEMGFANEGASTIISGQQISADKYSSLSGNNLTEYIVPEGSKISVEDADTITIRDVNLSRPGMSKMGGDPGLMKVRLAGIDAPETAHAGRAAQPYAEEAKRIANEMISKAKDVRIVAQEGNSTYGRQVAMVYADGVNVNLELIKRGAAAYLPYKSKKAPAMYNEQAFEEAQERAYESKRGMWREPFFQAYKMITKASNQTTTFNTLVNMKKVAKNGHLMSMRAMMDQAQEMGINNESELALAELGKSIGSAENPFTPDNGKNAWSKMDLQLYGGVNNTILSVLDRQKHEIGNLMSSRGSLVQNEKTKTSKITRNNIEMTKNVLAENEYKEENLARKQINQNMSDLKLKRLKKMEQMQQIALGNQFNSPIGHHRI